ncbi:MAG: hypothetical protein HeimC2_33080, partial [Candidatus Heimdallarchaeota archaeon LC_2]
TKLLIAGINRSSILQSEDERGVPLKDINVFSRSDLRSVAKSGIFEMNEIDTLQELLYQVSTDIFQGEDYVLQQVVDLQAICKIPIAKIGDINSDEVELLNSQGIITIADTLLISFDDLPTNDQRVYEALNYVTSSIMDLSPFVAMAKLPAHVVQEEEDTRVLINVWLHDSDELDERSIRNIRSLLSMPIKLTSYYKMYAGLKTDIETKTFADILLEYVPEDHPNTLLTNELKKQGSIIKLLREGSTPITLLALDAQAFRSLMESGLTSVEKVILVDDKRLALISGLTQKYWKNLKEVFDPEIFLAQLENMGLSLEILNLESKELLELKEHGIGYLDQTSVYMQPSGVILKIHKFIFSSSLFLVGTPGEKEIAENLGARNLIESMLVMRNQGVSSELLVEMISIAWKAYNQNIIELPKPIQESCESIKIYSVQDLVSYVVHNPKSNKKWVDATTTYLKSPLLLPLSADELTDLISVNRCSTIIEALTTPMTLGKISQIREEIKKTGSIQIDEKLEFNNKIISKLSKAHYNRISKFDISLQDIISSPRTLNEFKGISQKYLNELRAVLKIPMSRLFNENIILPTSRKEFDKIMRLDDLIVYYPSISKENSELGNIIRRWIESDHLKIIRDQEIPKEAQLAAETALNIPINGFHELWTATWQGATSFRKIDSKPAQYIKEIISNSAKSILSLEQLKPSEYWGLYKNGIYTLSDIILTSEKKITSDPNFTKKRVAEIREATIKAIIEGIKDPSKNLRDISDIFGIDKFTQSEKSIIAFRAPHPHPILPKIEIDKNLKEFILSPIANTDIANELKFESLKVILKSGVYTVLDLLNYPEKLPQPKSISTFDRRLGLIKKSTKSVVKPLHLDRFKFPSEIINQFDHRNDLNLFVSFMLQGSNGSLALLEYPLSYTSLDSDKINALNRSGIKSTFDLFIAPVNSISSIINDTNDSIIKLLEALDFNSLKETVSEMPLQISAIETVSKAGLSHLTKQNLFSLLDVGKIAPRGLNRNDEIQITTYLQILNSDLSLLFSSGIFSLSEYYQLKKEFSILTVREAFLQRNQLNSDQKKLLGNFTPNQLLQYMEISSKFSQLEILSLNDERILIKNGIYTFLDLLKTTRQELLGLKIAENKVIELGQILTVGWRSIDDLSKELTDYLDNLDINSVAEVLSINLPSEMNLPEKISVTKPIELRVFYHEGITPKVLIDNNILTLDDVLKTNKALKLYADQNEKFLSLLKFLHQSIKSISNIPNKWVVKLENEKIYRIWQYLITDSGSLASICSSSSKAQDDVKIGITFENIKIRDKLTYKVVIENDEKILFNNGFISASELVQDGLLTKYIAKNKATEKIIANYIKAAELEIWKISSFWDLDKVNRWRIARKYTTIRELLQDEIKLGSKILNDAVALNFIEEKSVNKWITDTSLKNLSVHNFAFNYYRGSINSDTQGLAVLLSPLDVIPSVKPSHIIQGYKHEITTVLDVLLITEEAKAKNKIGITSSEFENIINEFNSIELPETQIPKLGIVSTSIVNSLVEAGFFSWSQILGKFNEEELYGIKGITLKTVESIKETTDISITRYLELRALGLNTIQKLVKSGITTIFDLILIGSKLKKMLGTKTESILTNLTKSNLNKSLKHAEPKLSLSRQIKVGDLQVYQEAGVKTPVDIISGICKVSKNRDIQEGINDWLNLGKIEIKELKANEVIIGKLIQSGYKNLGELIVTPNFSLKKAGLSYKEIDEFRSTLFLPSKRPSIPSTQKISPKASKPKTIKKSSKKKAVKKTSKKKTAKKTGKRKTTKKTSKRKTAKKTSKRKTTKKASKRKTTKKASKKKTSKKKKSTKKSTKK